jgi:cell division protein ZapA (FtsZ GTPase activity inhibitor)
MSKTVKTTIDIYGQSFTIRAEPEEEEILMLVSEEVNDFLKDLSHKGTVAIHRLALMAAFQYAYELYNLKNAQPRSSQLSRKFKKRIDKIMDKLDVALEEE